MALSISSLLNKGLCQGPQIPKELFQSSKSFCSVSVNLNTVVFFGLGRSGKEIYSFDIQRNLWKFLNILPSLYAHQESEHCSGVAYFSKSYEL